MVSHSDIATRRRATWLRWVLPTIIVGLIIVGRLFCFVYRQPTPSGSSYHLMSRIAQPHRGDNVLLTLTADSLAGSKLMLRVVGEPSDTLCFTEGKLLVLGKMCIRDRPHRGDDVLLTLTSDSLAGSKLMLRVVGEPSDTLRFAEGKLLVLGKRGRQTFIMPLPLSLIHI